MTPCNAVSPSGFVCQKPKHHADPIHSVPYSAPLSSWHPPMQMAIEWSDPS